MAESNVTLNLGSGGSDVATMTDGSGYHHQKVVIGFDGGTSPTPVDTSNPLPVGDAGGSLTVDGTVTANLSATDNAVLDAIAASVAGTLTVGSHAVTNAGTFAVQATGTVDLGATDNAVLDAIAASLALLDNSIASGNELQVDIVGALPAGANAIGTVTAVGAAAEDAAASGNPVLIGGRYDSSARTLETGDAGAIALNASGQVLVEIAAGAGSGGTAVADDADFVDGTTSLTPIGGVYESTPSSVTDGDIGMAGITSTRALRVHVESITGSQTDDAAFTPGTSIVSVIGAEFDDTTPDSVDEGDGGALRMSANRNLYSTIRDAAGNERGANVNASNQLAIAGPVTNAGTFAVQVDGSALTALQLLDNIVAVEDAVAGSGFSGVPFLAVRQDSHSDLAADGDFIAPTIDADGGLRVSIVAGAGSGGTAAADDADFTAGTTSGTPAMGVYESSPTSVTDGDLGTVGITQTRALRTVVEGTVTVGSHAVTNAGTFAVQATGTVDLGATDNAVLDAIAASLALIDNAIPSGNELQVDVVAALPAGTNNIGDVDVLTLPNVTLAAGTNTNEVVGDAADDAAAAGNPVSVGGYAIQTDGTDPGVVSAEGDVARLRTDMQRNLLVNITHPRLFNVSADYASAQTNASVQAAPGAGLSLYITDLIISNGATAGNITLLDGSGGTVKFEIYPAINGGVAHSFRNPIRLTANTALCITSTTVTTHSICVSGYIAP